MTHPSPLRAPAEKTPRAPTAMKPDWTTAQLLATELEVAADFDLQPLLDHLRAEVSVVRNSVDDGQHVLWVELNDHPPDVNAAVHRYVDLIEALPTHLRDLWRTASDRCLNTGVQSGVSPHALSVQLSVDAMARASRLALRHTVTVYATAPEPEAPTGDDTDQGDDPTAERTEGEPPAALEPKPTKE